MNIGNNTGSSRLLDRAQQTQQTQLERISSGKRINSAKDDAAGLVISTGLDTESRSLTAALKNTGDGISRIQVEDGELSSVSEDLQRIRELSLQQQNGILSESDQQALQSEIDQRIESIDNTLKDSEFNGKAVFEEGSLSIQSGAQAGQNIEIATEGLASQFSELGLSGGSENIDLNAIDEALNQVSQRRSDLGATQSRLESNAEFLELKNGQNQSANSRIRDTDFAKATADKTKADIQTSALIGVQAQANQNQENVLRLLNG
jgi:flagellin